MTDAAINDSEFMNLMAAGYAPRAVLPAVQKTTLPSKSSGGPVSTANIDVQSMVDAVAEQGATNQAAARLTAKENESISAIATKMRGTYEDAAAAQERLVSDSMLSVRDVEAAMQRRARLMGADVMDPNSVTAKAAESFKQNSVASLAAAEEVKSLAGKNFFTDGPIDTIISNFKLPLAQQKLQAAETARSVAGKILFDSDQELTMAAQTEKILRANTSSKNVSDSALVASVQLRNLAASEGTKAANANIGAIEAWRRGSEALVNSYEAQYKIIATEEGQQRLRITTDQQIAHTNMVLKNMRDQQQANEIQSNLIIRGLQATGVGQGQIDAVMSMIKNPAMQKEFVQFANIGIQEAMNGGVQRLGVTAAQAIGIIDNPMIPGNFTGTPQERSVAWLREQRNTLAQRADLRGKKPSELEAELQKSLFPKMQLELMNPDKSDLYRIPDLTTIASKTSFKEGNPDFYGSVLAVPIANGTKSLSNEVIMERTLQAVSEGKLDAGAAAKGLAAYYKTGIDYQNQVVNGKLNILPIQKYPVAIQAGGNRVTIETTSMADILTKLLTIQRSRPQGKIPVPTPAPVDPLNTPQSAVPANWRTE